MSRICGRRLSQKECTVSTPPIGNQLPLAENSQLSDRRNVHRSRVKNSVSDIVLDPESNSDSQTTIGLSGEKREQSAVISNEPVLPAARIIRRPGRNVAKFHRSIEFPPKPHRSRRGLANTGEKNSLTAKRNVNTTKNRRPHLSRNADPLYAALDLGTNNCRLLVALPQQFGKFRVVDAFSRIVRLGKGLEKSGKLDEDAMDRAIEALGECAKKLKNSNITKVRLIATEACRRAENGEKFLQRVLQETGLELEIVNRKTEAQLAAEGCGALVEKHADGAVLFDIGGGSSELILLDRRGRKNKKISKQISSWTSLPVGVVTLSERHGGRNVSKKLFEEMVDDVDNHISKFEGRATLDEFWSDGNVHLLGTSGTVTTLAGVHLDLPRYDRRKIDGIWLNDFEVDAVIEQLVEMDFERRALNPCIGKERADLVLAGCAILQSIRKRWPARRLRVADRGLREGILTQLMNQDGVWYKYKKNQKSQFKKQKHSGMGDNTSGKGLSNG